MSGQSSLLNGRYKKVKVWRTGAFGKTFRVKDSQDMNKEKIAKEISLLNDSNPERTRREARYLCEFNHPNVLRGLDFFETYDLNNVLLCIVTEFCENGDLHERIVSFQEKNEHFSFLEILDYLTQLANALVYIHEEKGLVHRDLKPENIFLKNNFKTLKLGDFGLTRQITELGSTFQFGTINYASPERILMAKLRDPKSDCWAFGCVVYELNTLKRAFTSLNPEPDIVSGRIPQLINNEFSSLYYKLMTVDVMERISSAQALDLLERIKARSVIDSTNAEAYLKWKKSNKFTTGLVKYVISNAFSSVNQSTMNLDLSLNFIEAIQPNAFAGLTQLQSLELNSNRLTSIERETFSSLVNLTQLILVDNKIQFIDESAFNALGKLKILNLSNNELSQIEPRTFEFLNKLKALNLSENRLEFLNTNMFKNQTKLSELDLTRNRIRLINMDMFGKLARLQTLNLSENQLSRLNPRDFASLKNLQIVHLRFNPLENMSELKRYFVSKDVQIL